MFERRRIFSLEDVCANCTHGIGEIHVPHDDVAEILHHAKLDLIMFKSHIDILPAVPPLEHPGFQLGERRMDADDFDWLSLVTLPHIRYTLQIQNDDVAGVKSLRCDSVAAPTNFCRSNYVLPDIELILRDEMVGIFLWEVPRASGSGLDRLEAAGATKLLNDRGFS